MAIKYLMLKDSDLEPRAVAGSTVYHCATYDFGIADADSRRTGRKHIAVTLNPNGSYPVFTVPEHEVAMVAEEQVAEDPRART